MTQPLDDFFSREGDRAIKRTLAWLFEQSQLLFSYYFPPSLIASVDGGLAVMSGRALVGRARVAKRLAVEDGLTEHRNLVLGTNGRG
jgi:hypothetical protein